MNAPDSQNPAATPADPPFDDPSRVVQKTANRWGEPQEPDEAVGEYRVGPDRPENYLDVPYLDREDDLGINDDLATLNEWWTHIGWEGFGGWGHSHHKFVYPGGTVVPVYAEPVEQHVLYLKTKAYSDDTGYWRDGQNPMMDALIDTSEMNEREFWETVIELTNAAYAYTRKYRKRRNRCTDDEPTSTDTRWSKRTPEDARQGAFRPRPELNPLS